VKLNKEQLQFFFDEVLGELGWHDEIEETGIDPLAYVRDEISSLRRHLRRFSEMHHNNTVLPHALYLSATWQTLVDNGYLTQEFINEHIGVVSAATIAAKTIDELAAAEHRVQRTGDESALCNCSWHLYGGKHEESCPARR